MVLKLRTMGMRFKKDQRGFTLIELLVVIAVIGVLATLAVPRVVGVIDEAKGNRGKSDVKVIAIALERYYLAQGSYPASLKVLKVDGYLKGNVDLENPYGYVYFYALPLGSSPQEYVLGDPGKTPGTDMDYPYEGPPPEGKDPDDPVHPAWTWGSGGDFSAKPSTYDGVVTD